jgi:hypothetical protein
VDENQIEARLRNLGKAPVDPDLSAAHLTQMATVRPVVAAKTRRSWRAIAAAAVVGFLAGSTGLAAAGTLPAPAQDVAHSVLGAVGVDVPRSTEDCPDGRSYRNHGEYVAEVEAAGGDVEAAARSRCGKPDPERKGQGKGDGGKPAGAREDRDGDPCTGPPPWAGQKLSAEEKLGLQEGRAAKCGTEEVEDAEARESEPEAESTTTTEAPTTTTEAPTTTTTEAATTTTTTG